MKDTVLILGDVFNVLPDTMLVVDASGSIVFANTAVTGLLGYGPEELMGRPLGDLIPERFRAAHETHLATFRDTGKTTSMGVRPLLKAVCKSGEETPVSISIANLDLGGERFFNGSGGQSCRCTESDCRRA